MTRAYRYWTLKEERLLADAWASDRPIKEFLHLFGDRSYEAVIEHAHRDMGLGARPIKVRCKYSAVWDSVQRLLASGSLLTARDLAERAGVSQRQVTDQLRRHHKGEDKDVHIATWRRPGAGWNWVEVWAIGDGPDAPRPKARTKADRNLAKRTRRAVQERVRIGGAFGAAMAQLAGMSV